MGAMAAVVGDTLAIRTRAVGAVQTEARWYQWCSLVATVWSVGRCVCVRVLACRLRRFTLPIHHSDSPACQPDRAARVSCSHMPNASGRLSLSVSLAPSRF